jgi:Spy/CpxP family protein refolding chaperone
MSGKSRAGWAAAGLVLLGFALGVLADHLWLAYRMHHRPAPEVTHSEAVAVMLQSLDLTDEQRASVGAIFDRYQAKVEEQLEAIHPKLLATIDSARFEIEALLDPRQLETFRNWLRAEHERGRPAPFILH